MFLGAKQNLELTSFLLAPKKFFAGAKQITGVNNFVGAKTFTAAKTIFGDSFGAKTILVTKHLRQKLFEA